MTAVTYDLARTHAREPAKAECEAKAALRNSFFARVMDAVYESRMRQARREIARYVHLLPYTLDERGDRIVKTGTGDMLFGGW